MTNGPDCVHAVVALDCETLERFHLGIYYVFIQASALQVSTRLHVKRRSGSRDLPQFHAPVWLSVRKRQSVLTTLSCMHVVGQYYRTSATALNDPRPCCTCI